MLHDETADSLRSANLDACLDTTFAVVRPPAPKFGRAYVRRAFPFGSPGRERLPDAGWDAVIRWAHEDRMLRRPTNVLSASEITLLPSHRGKGGSASSCALSQSIRVPRLPKLFAPVRPTANASNHLPRSVSMHCGRWRIAIRPVVACPRPRGWCDCEGRARQHGDGRRLGGLDPMDWPHLCVLGPACGSGGAGAGSYFGGARPRGLCGTERLAASQHRGIGQQ